MAEYIQKPTQVVNVGDTVIFNTVMSTLAGGFNKADLMAKKVIESIAANSGELFKTNSIYRKLVTWKFRKRNPKTRYKQLEKARKMNSGQSAV